MVEGFWIMGSSFIGLTVIVIETESVSPPESTNHRVKVSDPCALDTELKIKTSVSEYSPLTVTNDVSSPVMYQSKLVSESSISDSKLDR